jgi:hypothetical protein
MINDDNSVSEHQTTTETVNSRIGKKASFKNIWKKWIKTIEMR